MGKTNNTFVGKQRSQAYFTWQRLKKNKGAMMGLVFLGFLVLLMLFAGVLFDYNTLVVAQNPAQRLQAPSSAHWFGTDEGGRDILARVVHGARYSVLISLAAVLMATVIGGFFGAVAGFYGGKLGGVIMRFMDVLLAIPSTLFGLIIVAALGASIPNLAIAVSAATIPKMARILRSSVMTCTDAEYVEAARARGAKDVTILLKHVLPNSIAPLFVQVTVSVGQTIILLSGLSFMGLGVQPPAPEWGALLSNARQYILHYGYMCIFPGLAILLTIVSINLLGDGLRDAMDPKLK